MSVSRLRAFDAVARTLSFSSAAALLGRTQPTITMQVARLEAQYGLELFHRKRGGGVILTRIGEELRGITGHLLALEHDATSLLENAGKLVAGSLRVGAIAPRSATMFLTAFRKQHPGIEVSLAFGNSSWVLDEIRSCRIDVGILGGHGNSPECEARILSRPEIVLLANETHPAAARGTLSRSEFSRQTLLLREPGSETRDLVLSQMDTMNYRPKTIIEIGSREGVCAAAAAGLGIAAISAEELEQTPSVRVLRFKDFRVFGLMHAVCLHRRMNTRLIKAFFDVIESVSVEASRRIA